MGTHIAAAGTRIMDAYSNAHDVASKLAVNDFLPRHAVTG